MQTTDVNENDLFSEECLCRDCYLTVDKYLKLKDKLDLHQYKELTDVLSASCYLYGGSLACQDVFYEGTCIQFLYIIHNIPTRYYRLKDSMQLPGHLTALSERHYDWINQIRKCKQLNEI